MEINPSTSEVIYWSIDPADGTVQGPLDLGFMRGKVLHLTLAPGQIALHICQGELRAVFLEGVHAMRVGRLSSDLPVDSAIIFLVIDKPLRFRWEGADAVTVHGQDGKEQEIRLRGEGECHIVGPERFHSAFFRHCEQETGPFLHRVVECLLRSQIEKRLNEVPEPDAGVSASAPADRLAALEPADINSGLAEFGLACSRLEVQADIPSQQPSTQTAGQPVSSHGKRGQ